jgi:hypothetical protein
VNPSLPALTPADLGWTEEEAGEAPTRADLVGLVGALLAQIRDVKGEIAELRLEVTPKAETVRPSRLRDDTVEQWNAAVLAANAGLVLQAGQLLTQPEAQLRWFDAALNNGPLRKQLTKEQVAIYERMVPLLRSISAQAIYDGLHKKLLAAGFDDPAGELAL